MKFSSRVLAFVCTAAASIARSEPFPEKPLHFVVAAPGGGQSDLGARLLGREFTNRLQQPVVVENRPGANYTIAIRAVMSAPPDGYMLFFGSPITAHPVFVKTGAIDAVKALEPVSDFYSIPFFLFVNTKIPVNTLPELVSYSKANPGKVNFGSVATVLGLLNTLLKSNMGLDSTVIPYNGSPAVIAAMLNGEVDFTINSLAAYRGQVEAGKVKPLMVLSQNRSTFLPAVPTAAESGAAVVETTCCVNGLWAPLGTPKDVVQVLYREVASSARSPEVVAQIRKVSTAEPLGSTPEQQLADFERDVKFWTEAARVAKFQPE
jgi:tripartite-type tricarboxylate transporter receptor subunit TctC